MGLVPFWFWMGIEFNALLVLKHQNHAMQLAIFMLYLLLPFQYMYFLHFIKYIIYHVLYDNKYCVLFNKYQLSTICPANKNNENKALLFFFYHICLLWIHPKFVHASSHLVYYILQVSVLDFFFGHTLEYTTMLVYSDIRVYASQKFWIYIYVVHLTVIRCLELHWKHTAWNIKQILQHL